MGQKDRRFEYLVDEIDGYFGSIFTMDQESLFSKKLYGLDVSQSYQ